MQFTVAICCIILLKYKYEINEYMHKSGHQSVIFKLIYKDLIRRWGKSEDPGRNLHSHRKNMAQIVT